MDEMCAEVCNSCVIKPPEFHQDLAKDQEHQDGQQATEEAAGIRNLTQGESGR